MERSVIRLSHCHKDIFCFSLPEECPSCGERLQGSRLLEAPVSLPSPLADGHKSSCCLLVTPADSNTHRKMFCWGEALDVPRFEKPGWKRSHYTTASFLRDFEGTSDLHTGISSTSGVVYNYTERGVSRDMSGWQCCISVPLVRPDRFHLLAQWDQYLDRFSDGPMWDPMWHSFDEDNHNCFSFCLQFINSVLAVEGRAPLTRDTFTRSFILPRMMRVSKYMTLCRHIEREDVYVVDRQAEGRDEA